jgi:N-acetylglutamate synthase-like GNAT family acetyltransferase
MRCASSPRAEPLAGEAAGAHLRGGVHAIEPGVDDFAVALHHGGVVGEVGQELGGSVAHELIAVVAEPPVAKRRRG